MSDTSWAEAAAQMIAVVGRLAALEGELNAWSSGTATGGPNGDGRYPFSQPDSTVVLVPCVAAIVAAAGDGGGGLDADGVAALPQAVAADAGNNFRFLGVAQDGSPKRFAPAIVPSPVPDLPRAVAALASDLMEIGRGGSRMALPLAAFSRLTTGKINVKEAPYNCKGDFREVRDGVVTQGSNTLKSASKPWLPTDIGKVLVIGNASAGRATMTRTITGYVSAGEITFGAGAAGGPSAASYGDANLVVGWGTDDTAGMRAALLAAAPPAGLVNVFGGVVELPPGFYLCDHLYLPPRTAFFGYGPRQSVIVRKPSASTVPTISNADPADDFPVLINMGIYGLSKLAGAAQHGYYYGATAGFGNYYYTDPYPHWHGLGFWETSGDALVHAGQGNGILTDVNIANPRASGFRSTGFDMDIANLYVIAAGCAAVWLDYGAAGNNINNGKFSYSGGNAFAQTSHGYDVGPLVYIGLESSKNRFNNCRAQESFLSAWALGGRHNSLTACGAEDVGNVGYTPAVQPANKPRAAVQLLPGAVDCIIDVHHTYDIPYGNAINRATHCLFVSNPAGTNNPPTWNAGVIRTLHTMRADTDYSNGMTATDGRPVPPTTGLYARAVIGTDDPAGISATNSDLSVNRTAVA